MNVLPAKQVKLGANSAARAMTTATATCYFAAVLAADAAGYSHRAQSWSVGRMSALH
jgi:hypothetical protein